MAAQELKEVTDKAIQKGGMLVKLYFDMQSEKSEELQPLMADLINNRLLKAPGVIYCTGSIDEPMKLKDVYTTNAVVDVLFKDLGALINVVFNFAPIGLDILRPEKDFSIKISELNSIMVSLSQISAEYSKYILTRVLTPEDLEKVKKEMENRHEMGKKLMQSPKSDGQVPQEKPL